MDYPSLPLIAYLLVYTFLSVLVGYNLGLRAIPDHPIIMLQALSDYYAKKRKTICKDLIDKCMTLHFNKGQS